MKMDISQLLGSDVAQEVINGISKNSNVSEKETHSVIDAAAPVLMGMLHKNSSSEEGASGILGALKKHDGSILSNISGALGSQETKADGQGILGHILGGQKSNVEEQISQKTGVATSKVSNIIAMLAPIIMGHLGKKANENNVSSGGGLSSILGGLVENVDMSSLGGDILGSVLGGGSKGKSGGLGGMIGGIFGKK